jgi:phage repressor protein C with HTH and peptisase S24 domain
MSTLAERVAECLAEVADRVKVKESAAKTLLARAVGIKPPSVYDWLNGTTKKLEGGNLNRAAAFFGVEADWLETGLGPKRVPEKSGDWWAGDGKNNLVFDGNKVIAAHEVEENLEKYSAELQSEVLAMSNLEPAPRPPRAPADRYAYVPVYNVKGGMGNGSSYAHEEIEGKHSYSQAWLIEEGLAVSNLVRMKGEGDSMLPTIADGDTLLINKSETKINGRVYAFRVGDEIRVKRLFRQLDGRVRVVSDNPDKNLYPDEFLSVDDQPEIIGRVRDRSGKNGL